MDKIEKDIALLKEEGLYRQLKITNEGVDFLSNDYLGLGLKKRTLKSFGSGGSRLLSGNYKELVKLEENLAEFHGFESALFFPSGYQANIALLSCLANRHDQYIQDELCHASLKDGIRLSLASKLTFAHQDLVALEKRCATSKGQSYVVTESVFSMNGQISDLNSIRAICKKQNAVLIVDEAHSCGIFGEEGKGFIHSLSVSEQKRIIKIVPFGKAYGSSGAAILSNQAIRNHLVNNSRPFIYSTAPAYALVHDIQIQLERIKNASQERLQLKMLINYWNENKPKNLDWIHSDSPIQSLIIPGNFSVIQKAEALQNLGFKTLPIRSPSVQKGTERIRFVIHALNTKSEIDKLFTCLNNLS